MFSTPKNNRTLLSIPISTTSNMIKPHSISNSKKSASSQGRTTLPFNSAFSPYFEARKAASFLNSRYGKKGCGMKRLKKTPVGRIFFPDPPDQIHEGPAVPARPHVRLCPCCLGSTPSLSTSSTSQSTLVCCKFPTSSIVQVSF